jgi:hypothetical protein
MATEYYHGFFHIEMMVHQGKPYVIELNPRCGGRIPKMVSLVYKQDFYREFFALCQGGSPHFGLPQCGASAFYVFPHKQGIWAGFNDSILKQYPSIKAVRPNPDRRIGERLGPICSIRDNIMLVFFEEETTELVHAVTRAFISEVPMYLQIESPPKIKSKHVQRSFWGRLKHRVKSFLYKP